MMIADQSEGGRGDSVKRIKTDFSESFDTVRLPWGPVPTRPPAILTLVGRLCHNQRGDHNTGAGKYKELNC